MSDTHTDLVIQISNSAPELRDAGSSAIPDRRLIQELRRCLQPGVEFALVFGNYMATTSILWLSDLQPDGSVRAGVRLLGVSALADKPRTAVPANDVSRALPDASFDRTALSHSV